MKRTFIIGVRIYITAEADEVEKVYVGINLSVHSLWIR